MNESYRGEELEPRAELLRLSEKYHELAKLDTPLSLEGYTRQLSRQRGSGPRRNG